jgi:hypothetical protein
MYEYIIDAKKSFIGAWFFEDQSLCDDLIYYFEQNPNKVTGEIHRSIDKFPKVDKEEKDSIDLDLKLDTTMGKRYVTELQKVLEMYKIKYPSCDRTSKYEIESINLQKYNPQGGYKSWHTERSGGLFPGAYRHLVFMTYLNDVDDEGETEFEYQNVKIKPKKGLTLIWPADWTHTHRGIPSDSQIKYIATGWYSFSSQTS